MTPTPTPGQVAYESYAKRMQKQHAMSLWGFMLPDMRDAWEAAAQAVLEAFVSSAQRLMPPQEEPHGA